MRRFPLRTLILMAVALIVFVRMWIVTHGKRAEEPGEPGPPGPEMKVEVAPPSPPPPPSEAACKAVEQALSAVLRRPSDSAAPGQAKRLLEDCPQPPARACELGTALDARVPMAAGDAPAREVLKLLCQRCPAKANACSAKVNRMLVEASAGYARNVAEAVWNLENAGAGTPSACKALVGATLVPAAVTGARFTPELRPLLTALAPLCAKEGHLPGALLSATVINQGAQGRELAGLVQAPAVESSPVTPGQITGSEQGHLAFDGKAKPGVELVKKWTHRWEADGALRAQFVPALKQLTALRLRAKGAGTLRAIVRTSPGWGMEDRERGFFFVNPTVCHFKGTGQWEACALNVPLLEVEALSVFPAESKLTVYEVEVRGAR